MQLQFPELAYIKKHKRHPDPKDKDFYEEYKWDIFDFPEWGPYCRIVYNEDDNGKIYLDMMVNGYCDSWHIEGFNKAYPATKKGYEELKAVAQSFVDKMINGIYKSNTEYKESWE